MSTIKIINDFNRCLLREKFYEYKYNINNFKKKHNDIQALFETIKNNEYYNEFQDLKFNDSLTTTEAMNNPHLEKLSKYLKTIKKNKNYKFYKERIPSSRKRNYNIKTLDILKYSDCVTIPQKKNKSKDGVLIQRRTNKKIVKDKIKDFNKENKERPLSSKPFYNEFQKKIKRINIETDEDKHLNIYKNKKFKDCLSSFLYHVNNITAYQKENSKSNSDSIKKDNIKFYNNEISKYISKNKYNNKRETKEIKEIKRFEVDVSNIFLIQKPLISSIRGKILKNIKKRFKRPIRNILKSNIFYDYKES